MELSLNQDKAHRRRREKIACDMKATVLPIVYWIHDCSLIDLVLDLTFVLVIESMLLC